jgi:hypothetical protein
VATILGIFFFSSFLGTIIQNPRSACLRVSNFCMGS